MFLWSLSKSDLSQRLDAPVASFGPRGEHLLNIWSNVDSAARFVNKPVQAEISIISIFTIL